MDPAVDENWAPYSQQAFPTLRSSNTMTLGHFLEATFVCLFHKSLEKKAFFVTPFLLILRARKKKTSSEFTIRFLVQLQLTDL